MAYNHPTYGKLEHCEYKSIDECFQSWAEGQDADSGQEYNTSKKHILGSLSALIEDISYAIDNKSFEITNIPNTLLICPRTDLIDFIQGIISKPDYIGFIRDFEYIWEDCFGKFHPYKDLQVLSKRELVYLIINMENFGCRMDLHGFLEKYDRQPLTEKLQQLGTILASFQSEFEKVSYADEIHKCNKIPVKFPCEDLLDCSED